MAFFENLVDIILDASFWLLAGLILAGLIHALVPMRWVIRLMAGRGISPLVRAAVVGAPLPLCSCGVLPVAASLRRQGASKGATASFLVSTPETGVDSVALSYAMLGPLMTIVRPVAAIISAVVTGLVVSLSDSRDDDLTPTTAEKAQPSGSCGCGEKSGPGDAQIEASGCEASAASVAMAPAPCGDTENAAEGGCCATAAEADQESDLPTSVFGRGASGIRYALTSLLDDLAIWLLVGLALAAGLATLMEPGALKDVGSGLPAMLVLAVVGIPMYICATASTPLAAAMLLSGVSPGAVLVFLLAGPADNIASLGIVRQMLGFRALVAYLLGVVGAAILCGLALDALVPASMIVGQVSEMREVELVPTWLSVGSAAILILSAIPPFRRWAGSLFLKVHRRRSKVAIVHEQ